MDEFVKWFGERVFPQRADIVLEQFPASTVVEAVRLGYVIQSSATMGSSPNQMLKPRSLYIDLTEIGWDKYQELSVTKVNNK